jgi:hypothetical protein
MRDKTAHHEDGKSYLVRLDSRNLDTTLHDLQESLVSTAASASRNILGKSPVPLRYTRTSATPENSANQLYSP